MKRRLLVFPFALLGLLFVATPVFAHAVLLRSNPAANAALATPPAQAELWLSEPVEPAFTEVKVLDSTGARVDDAATRLDPADPTHVKVGLRSIRDGVYTVSWRALSTVDGHVTLGAFPFAVGNFDQAALAAGAAGKEARGTNVGEVIPRWLALLGAAMAVGGYLFSAYVWFPAWRQSTNSNSNSILKLFLSIRRAGLALFLGASIGALLWQAGSASGLSPLQTLLNPALGDLLFATRYGLLWLGRIALALALMLSDRRWERWLQYVRPLAAAWLLLTLSLNSHAAAASSPFLPVFSDWLHIVAASIWLGGLVHFALGCYSTRRLDPAGRTRLAAALVPRFSNLGLVSVGALFLTGLYNATVTVGSVAGLFETDYGRGLLLKLWIIVPLIGLAAINLLVLRPALTAARESDSAGGPGARSLARHLSVTVTGEVLLGASVLFAAASFATLPPARTLTSGLTFNQRAEDLRVTLSIAPGKVGVNQFDVRLANLGLAGGPVTDASEVALRFTPLSGELPPSEAFLGNQQDGHYSAQGSHLSLLGGWQAQVVVRRAGHFDAFANFDLQVAAPGQAGGTSAQVALARYAAVALYAIGLLYVLALRGLTHTQAQQTFLGLIPALALAFAGLVVFRGASARGQAGPAGLVNPIAPSVASLERGQALYQQNCLPCHGATGLGDGPAGLLLNPRPANLQQHMIPGVHTDGQIFDWITNGYPASAMPPFRDTLTEEERWHVLNYMRTLTPRT